MHRCLRLPLLASSLLLGACNANHYAIYHEIDAPRHPTLAIDAKQRVVIAKERMPLFDDHFGVSRDSMDNTRKAEQAQRAAMAASRANTMGKAADATSSAPPLDSAGTLASGEAPSPGPVDKEIVICAEPSPDAISALSSSLNTSGSFSLSDPSGKEIAAALAIALAQTEAAGYVGLRTQTIQLLRDGMYRLCEGYANAALTRHDYTRLQRRYQNTMLALLAIEQLTGAVATRQVTLDPKAAAVAGETLQTLQKELVEAMKTKVDKDQALADAKAAAEKADAKVVAAQNELKQCGDCAQKSALESAVAEAEKEQKVAATALAKATLEANNQNALVARLETAVKSSAVALNAYASGTSTGAGHDLTETNRTVVSAALADSLGNTVRKIVYGTVIGSFAIEECMTAPRSTGQQSEISLEFARQFCADMAASMLKAMFDGNDPAAPALEDTRAARANRPAAPNAPR